MKTKVLWGLMGVGALMAGAQLAYTAPLTDSASQTFTVNVPKRVSITAPTSPAPLTLPDSSNPLAFPGQAWQVKGNVRSGVSVNFKTTQAFVHTTENTYKRDAKLTLALTSSTGPATWTAGTLTDQTNYSGADEEALVSYSSNKVGQAVFDLGVEFLTVDIAEVAEGDYTTTVIGTVTEN